MNKLINIGWFRFGLEIGFVSMVCLTSVLRGCVVGYHEH